MDEPDPELEAGKAAEAPADAVSSGTQEAEQDAGPGAETLAKLNAAATSVSVLAGEPPAPAEREEKKGGEGDKGADDAAGEDDGDADEPPRLSDEAKTYADFFQDDPLYPTQFAEERKACQLGPLVPLVFELPADLAGYAELLAALHPPGAPRKLVAEELRRETPEGWMVLAITQTIRYPKTSNRKRH